MTQEMLIMAAILVAVILLTFIGILSRYRKCKSDEVLVVYGKTGGDLPMGFAAAAACAGTFSEKIPDREKIQRAQ